MFGAHPELPRALALLFGLGTVGATYLLGRQLGRPLTGGIAAGLLATPGTHILVNSRVAWSHSITPLFAKLAIWLLVTASVRGAGPRLALARLSCGLAVQTHITAGAMVPWIAAFVLARRRSWLGDRWAWLGVVLFLVVNANALLFHPTHGPREMLDRAAATHGRSPGLELLLASVGGGNAPVGPFVESAGRLSLTFARILGGAVDIRPTMGAYIADPVILATIVLMLAGVVWLTRHVSGLPSLVLGGWAVLFLLVINKSDVIPNGRFLMPIVPLALALVACGIAASAGRLVRPGTSRGVLAVALAGVLARAALVRLEGRLGDLRASDRVSADLDRPVEAVLDGRGAEGRVATEPVFVDPLLQRLWLDRGGNVRTALRYRFRLAGVPVADLRERRDREDRDRFELDSCAANRIVLQRVAIGAGEPAERLLPAGAPPPAGTVWVLWAAEPREVVGGATLVVNHRPPISGSGRAANACDEDRLL